MGAAVSERTAELFAADKYQDYLLLHGLGVEMAEALAEYWHRRIREELGFADEDGPTLTGLFRQQYRGGRYSWGYEACPDLEDNEKVARAARRRPPRHHGERGDRLPVPAGADHQRHHLPPPEGQVLRRPLRGRSPSYRTFRDRWIPVTQRSGTMDRGSPPGPGWTLGEDGHWKPPPFEVGGPAAPVRARAARVAPPPAGDPPCAAAGRRHVAPAAAVAAAAVRELGEDGWGGRRRRSWARSALVAVVCIAAVTMLGTRVARSAFESVSTPTNDAARSRPDDRTRGHRADRRRRAHRGRATRRSWPAPPSSTT